MSTPSLTWRGGRSRRGRLLALLAIPALVVPLLVAAPGSGSVTADTGGAAPNPGSPVVDADFASLTGDVEPTEVTLITGDTVLWQDAGNGKPGVSEIEQAPRDYPVTFDQSGTQEDFYVIPTDVMEQVVSGALDRELFNIPSLVEQGLDDESTGGELPVIVTFDTARSPQQLERDANALPAADEAQAVKGIQGAGVKVDRGNAEKFRKAVLGAPNTKHGPSTNAQSDSLAGAVDKVLLDQMLEIDLSESVPQIGAPAAWDAGFTGEGVTVAVIDTGVDASHPDLAGQVVAAENFVGDGEPVDDHGHGTHVASTIAGTGAASDGARKGVAPDAELLSGKVCNAEGQCATSAIMAGMEWATAQGADVVNMSLGGAPTDGTDPLCQLLNELAAETGTLFVISAGNAGGLRTVGSPAAADAALAVGAVDKSDQMAGFSSRGPRVGDHAVKPEITAPGVGIVAARAEGTSLGDPVDDDYTSLNGTSMAAPHVAGAAALLASAKPDLDGGELKDALVSTAADGGFQLAQQGTGRVDVPAAVNSPVYAQGTVNFGGFEGQAERELIYTNHSASDVTLSLDAAVTDTGGQDSDAAGVTLSSDTLTVPANGTASVTVTATLDPTGLSADAAFGGVVTATATDGVELRTGIGFGPPLHRVTIEVLDSNGDRVGTDTASDWIVSLTHDTYDPEQGGEPLYQFSTSQGVAVGNVPTGTYTIITAAIEHEPRDTLTMTRVSMLVEVEVEIAADIHVVLDARDAVPIDVSVPREADKRNHGVQVIRELAVAGAPAFSLGAFGGRVPMYATPTPPGELAPLSLFVSWTLAEPQPLHLIPWMTGGVERCAVEPHRCYSDTPAYVYNLPIVYENGIPQNLHEHITRGDLVEVPTRFHADHPDALIQQEFAAFPLSSTKSPSLTGFRLWFRPGTVTEYFLADDRVRSFRRVDVERRPEGGQAEYMAMFSEDRFLAAEAGSRRAEERWLEGPLRTGIWDVREESLDNPAIRINWWAGGSRQTWRDGNDYFLAPQQTMDSTRGHSIGGLLIHTWRMWNTDTGTELDRNGSVFPLAPETATYRLEQVTDAPASVGLLTGQDTTTWTFTSRPSDAPVPDGYWCPLRNSLDPPFEPWAKVCQVQPLILLEYHLGLDINNRAPAGRTHRFTITAGHHSKAIDRSKVTDLTVQASFDGGDTWVDARVVGKAKDTWETGGFLPSSAPYQEFQVVLDIPPLQRTDGFVALRVKAEDANGGTVDQTIKRAYILKP